MQQASHAQQAPVWSPGLLDAFGADARASCKVGDAIPAFFSEPEHRVSVMETNIYQGNVYTYNFVRKDGEDTFKP
jgi:hypothetical protein